MSGVITDLTIAAKLAARHINKRVNGSAEPPPNLDNFKSRWQALINQAPEGLIKRTTWVTIPAKQAPWLGTEVFLEAGDQLSYFMEGRVYASKALDIWIEPTVQIWCKVSEHGAIFRGTRNSHSFTANDKGKLLLGNYFPNDWADTQGTRLQDDGIYNDVSGEICLLIIQWCDTAIQGLNQILQLGDVNDSIAQEHQRLSNGDITPNGWHHRWNIGPSEIYTKTQRHDGQPCIHCHTQKDVGILQYPVDMALNENSDISWQWCVEQLPSTIREDSLPSHDYLSIAVEFDNGRDISYFWSSTLKKDNGFDCPLPNWQGKEYHVVVRNGKNGLNEWQQESRNLYQDYKHYMGQPPQRIVAVWLISNSLFQRGAGIADFANIVLSDGLKSKKVL